MRMYEASPSSILKIDVDIRMSKHMLHRWIETRKRMLESMGYHVVDINYRYTKHGMHFWIILEEKLDSYTRAMLQFIAGDDHRRCFYNFYRARMGVFDYYNALFGVKIYEQV
jgi:hypothetical protein